MVLPIVHFKGSQVEFSAFHLGLFFLPKYPGVFSHKGLSTLRACFNCLSAVSIGLLDDILASKDFYLLLY